MGLGLLAASAAQAGPIGVHHPTQTASSGPIVEVAGGCGPGFRPVSWRDNWGRWHRRCVPIRHWY
ncbi:MAG TPA: hypothetical protein VFQ90_09685 [Stellaceae bacterium]|jgi:hypothetical protein|nr:hypothetical protein [Stellaceae bacterium]